MKNISLVGLTGLAGCGKDTLASLVEVDGWTKVAFADALKDICIKYLGLSYDDAYTQEGKMRFNEFWGMTNREILQRVGTDALRNGFNKDVWVKILELKVKQMLSDGKKVIIADCRFDNEAEMVLRLGGIMLEIKRNVESNLSSQEQKHASERGIDVKYIMGVLENDDTVQHLKDAFESFLK